VFFIRQPNFANLTHRQLIEKKNILFSFASGTFLTQSVLNGPLGPMHNVGKLGLLLQ